MSSPVTETVKAVEEIMSNFEQISLNELNESRRLFSRIDTKYVTDLATLYEVLQKVEKDYNVLEIDGKHVFLYDTIYLDTPDYHFYKQHVDGIELRTKVRTRHYVDSDLAYFEVKQKSRGSKKTNKFRVKVDPSAHGKIKGEGWDLHKKLYEKAYGFTPDHNLVPQTKTVYKRMTLTHKTLPEKVTIDIDLTFDHEGVRPLRFDELVVIEVKHERKGSNFMGKLLEKHGFGFRDHCSKYCLSLCYLDVAQEKEYFIETMQAINEIEQLREDILDAQYVNTIAKRM